MKYYFAYGSNMWETQIIKRCPDSRKIGIARLSGYRWIISSRGFANVVISNKDAVEGILYEISASDESTLDKCEGVDSGGYGKAMLCVIHKGKEKKALVYIDPTVHEGKPKPEYIERLNSALSDANLSMAYITRYVRNFIPERGK
ncbi:gamma-glutamylcyclotransferase [bacterium]|nr:gamma-glutamylcyclotransferase [bacterium]